MYKLLRLSRAKPYLDLSFSFVSFITASLRRLMPAMVFPQNRTAST